MQTQKIFSILGMLMMLSACGNSSTEISSSQSLSYQFIENGCDTGKHNFTSESDYCAGLQNDTLNHGCALTTRQDTFTQKCSGSFHNVSLSNNHGNGITTAVVPDNINYSAEKMGTFHIDASQLNSLTVTGVLKLKASANLPPLDQLNFSRAEAVFSSNCSPTASRFSSPNENGVIHFTLTGSTTDCAQDFQKISSPGGMLQLTHTLWAAPQQLDIYLVLLRISVI